MALKSSVFGSIQGRAVKTWIAEQVLHLGAEAEVTLGKFLGREAVAKIRRPSCKVLNLKKLGSLSRRRRKNVLGCLKAINVNPHNLRLFIK